MLRHILEDLQRAEVAVEPFEFQGHGEPLLHTDLWDLTRMTRELFPDSFLKVTTNAQGKVSEDALAADVDDIVCSIDGVDQESYEAKGVCSD